MYIKYVYKDAVKHLCQYMHDNVENQNDNMVCVYGSEGSGKSNMAGYLIKTYEPNFNIDTNYVYRMSEFKEILKRKEDINATFWMDELSNMANNRDWNTTDNKHFVEMLEMMRSRHWTCVMCIPSKDRIDKYIRENRISVEILCMPQRLRISGLMDRGVAEISVKNKYGSIKSIGYGKYPKLEQWDGEFKKKYEEKKLQSQNRKIDEVINGDEKEQAKGTKGKQMYDEQCRVRNEAILRIFESGKLSAKEIKEVYGFESLTRVYKCMDKAKDFRKRFENGEVEIVTMEEE